jgi:hypothetical protein
MVAWWTRRSIRAAAHSGRHRCASELRPGGRGCPGSAACRSVDDAEQRADGKFEAALEPGLDFLPAPVVHSDLASASALAAADEQRASSRIEIALGEGERLLDAQPGSPQDHDQAAKPAAVGPSASDTHDGDDLLDLRRISWVAQSLVAWRATRQKSRHRRRRAAPACTIELQLGHDPSSGS